MASVLVPLAQGCEELEAVTITDLLTRAGINVITAGLDENIFTASRGMKLVPDTKLDDVINDDFDMVLSAENLLEKETILVVKSALLQIRK